MSTREDREEALRIQAAKLRDKQARKKKRRLWRREYKSTGYQKPQIFEHVAFGHPRQIDGYIWPGMVDKKILDFMVGELDKNHPSRMPRLAPEDPEQEKVTMTEEAITLVTPGDDQSSDLTKRIYTGSTMDPRALMPSDPLLALDPATRKWAEESMKEIDYFTGVVDSDALKRWALDVQHVVSFKLANLSVDRDIPVWAIERDPYKIIEFLDFLYPEQETNPTQTRKAAMALEIINVRWRMHDPSENSRLHRMSDASIRKWEERLRRAGNEFWENSERGSALRWKHFDQQVKRAFGVETITNDIYDKPEVEEFMQCLELERYESPYDPEICEVCHGDTGEGPWNLRTFRFRTPEASFGTEGVGDMTFPRLLVYTCNDCASDIEEDDQASIVDRVAANLRIQFKQEINRHAVADRVEKLIENLIK